jgi:hypothetical protein
MHKKILVAAMLATGVLLAGCGGDDAKPTAVEAKNEAGKTVVGLKRRDSADRSYQDIVVDFRDQFYYGDEKHLAYRDLYWSTADKDYDKLASDFVPEYRQETDAFKRQDMLKALEPKLDEIYTKFHGAKNISVTLRDETGISGYDAATKSFKISSVVGDISTSVRKTSDADREFNYVYILPLVMGESYKDYVLTPSEEDARRIESYLSSKRQNAGDSVGVAVQIKGYVLDAQSTGNNDRYAIVATDAVSFLDPKTGEVIVTLQSKDLPNIIDVSTKSLSLPAEFNTEFRKKFGFGEVRSTHSVTG